MKPPPTDPREPGTLRWRDTARQLGFAMLPAPVLTAARLSPTAIRIYGIVVLHADTEGHAWPGRVLLADEAHCSLDTIDRSLKTLKECGLLTVSQPEKGAGSDYWLEPLTAAVLRRLQDPPTPETPGGSRTGAEGGSRTGAAG